jgi:ribosomal protein S6
MLERYKGMITAGGGTVHCALKISRRQLVYLIQKLAKAHYLCINIEAVCGRDGRNSGTCVQIQRRRSCAT